MRTIRKIGVILVVSLLITATGGFSIYQHICRCAGEKTASVFLEATCEHDHAAASCCNAAGGPSCCGEMPVKDTKHSCHDSDCCENSSRFFKINDSFQPGADRISLKPLPVLTALVFINAEEAIQSFSIQSINVSDLPPPDTGRQILLAHHQLKLDPFLV